MLQVNSRGQRFCFSPRLERTIMASRKDDNAGFQDTSSGSPVQYLVIYVNCFSLNVVHCLVEHLRFRFDVFFKA